MSDAADSVLSFAVCSLCRAFAAACLSCEVGSGCHLALAATNAGQAGV